MRSLSAFSACLRTPDCGSARSHRFHLRLEQLEERTVASVTSLPSMLVSPRSVEAGPALVRTAAESTARPGSDPCPNCGLRVDSAVVAGLAVGSGSPRTAGLQPANRLSVQDMPSVLPVIRAALVKDPGDDSGAHRSASGFTGGSLASDPPLADVASPLASGFHLDGSATPGGSVRSELGLPTLGNALGGRMDGMLDGVSNALDGMRDRFLGSGGLRDNPDGGLDGGSGGSENSGSGEHGSPDGGTDGGSATDSDNSEDEEDDSGEDESLYWPEDNGDGVWHPGSRLFAQSDDLQPDGLSSASINAAFTAGGVTGGFVFGGAMDGLNPDGFGLLRT